MKKALFLFVFSIVLLGTSFAQSYQVYSVKGDVKCINGKNETAATTGMQIHANTKVSIPAGGRLVILDEDNKKLQTIKTAVSGTLAELLKNDDVSVQQLTDSYLTYIKSKMTDSGGSQDRNYKQSAGTAYRDPDSLLLQSIFNEDTVKNSSDQ